MQMPSGMRRVAAVAPSVTASSVAAPVAIDPVAADMLPSAEMQFDTPSIEDELEEWKRARRKQFKLPWRQLSLMASLCFGLASFVLPDSMNDNVDYLLYGLSAASLAASFAKRREKKKAATA
jgi:hypothetical protein